METGTVSSLTSMRSNAALPQVTNLRSVRCARFRGGRLNMHQRPRPPRGHGDLPRAVGPARSVTGREQRSAPGRYEVRQNADSARVPAEIWSCGVRPDSPVLGFSSLPSERLTLRLVQPLAPAVGGWQARRRLLLVVVPGGPRGCAPPDARALPQRDRRQVRRPPGPC